MKPPLKGLKFPVFSADNRMNSVLFRISAVTLNMRQYSLYHTRPLATLLAVLGVCASLAWATDFSPTGAVPEAESAAPTVESIIARLLAAEEAQKARVSDLTLSAELCERRLNDDGTVKDEKRFEKEIYLGRASDSLGQMRLHEKYVRYFRDGELQDDDELRDEVNDRMEKKRKRRGNDLSTPISDVFRAAHRDAYSFTFNGIGRDSVSGRVCYLIAVEPKENDPKDRIRAIMWIDTTTAMIVKADFAPARLGSKFMFKLKELAMTIRYAPSIDGVWAPQRFDLNATGKAGFFFTVRIQASETYSNPRVNTGVSDTLFATVLGM